MLRYKADIKTIIYMIISLQFQLRLIVSILKINSNISLNLIIKKLLDKSMIGKTPLRIFYGI